MNDLPLDDIKRALTCHDVADKLLIDQPRKGDAICPVHKGGSLRIAETHWFCHGACKQGGDVIALHQFATGSTFIEAVKELAGWAGVAIKLDPAAVRKAEARRRSEDILHVAALFYAGLYEGSPAQAYAKGRNLDVADAHLGYAPDGWHGLVDHLRTAGIDLDQAVDAGLIKQHAEKKNYYDHLRGRLIIPAYDRGRCVYITGRSLDDSHDGSGKRTAPKFIHAALDAPPLYHLNGALKRGNQPIITESITDTLRLAAHHLPAAGLYGTAINEGQAATLRRFETLFVAAHNDKAGTAFVDRCAEHFGERIRIVPPPAPHNDWDEALAAGVEWQPDDTLTWFRWRLRAIPPNTDMTRLAPIIAPLLDYLATMDDPARASIYLDELAATLKWSRDVKREYERTIKAHRTAALKTSTDRQRVKSDDTGQRIDVKPDPTFINPAQAYHNGIVYVARTVTRHVIVQSKYGDEAYDTYRPAIITSDRRLIAPPELPKTAPPGAVIYLDDAETLALSKPVEQASDQWSYASYSSHLRGDAPDVLPHILYDRLLASIRSYVYFDDPGDYAIAALWAMGTYFHQAFDAFPYLIVNGHKGAGKTTLLHWLNHVCFNATHMVNTSEASLFRWIEATAPTLLIDEQEGLNSRKAAKEDKADLMGLYKSGYQRGAEVIRQDPNNPAIRQQFKVYCPKAFAAVEQFEDILSDRGVLVYMPKVDEETLTRHSIRARHTMSGVDFGAMRDDLYLLLMQWSDELATIRTTIKNSHSARFGELVFPLLCMATLVDSSRKQRGVLDSLTAAIERQSAKRTERNESTPEAMLAEALRVACEQAEIAMNDRPQPEEHPQRLASGFVVMDALHIAHAFRSLFPSANESYFRLEWLGKQVAKTTAINNWHPDTHVGKRTYRWRRTVQERNPQTFEVEPMVKLLSVYIVNPAAL